MIKNKWTRWKLRDGMHGAALVYKEERSRRRRSINRHHTHKRDRANHQEL